MVVQIGNKTYQVPLSTAVADGKPHKVYEVTAVAAATLIPLRICFPDTSALYDVAAADWGSGGAGAGQTEEIYLSDIPIDYPGRSMYDQTTAYVASSKKVPMLRLEHDREYYVNSTADLSALHEGNLLVVETGGKLGVAVDAKTTPDKQGHVFSLIDAVSTTIVAVRYKNQQYYDTS